jgi:hypothetical protein
MAAHYKYSGDEIKCWDCGEFWPIHTDFFYRSKLNKSGYRHQCKACVREQKLLLKNKKLTLMNGKI